MKKFIIPIVIIAACIGLFVYLGAKRISKGDSEEDMSPEHKTATRSSRPQFDENRADRNSMTPHSKDRRSFGGGFDLQSDQTLFAEAINSDDHAKIENYLRGVYQAVDRGSLTQLELDHLLVQVSSAFAVLSRMEKIESTVVKQWEALLVDLIENAEIEYSSRGRAVLAISKINKKAHSDYLLGMAQQIEVESPESEVFCCRCIIVASDGDPALYQQKLIGIARKAKNERISSVVSSVLGKRRDYSSVCELLSLRKNEVVMKRAIELELASSDYEIVLEDVSQLQADDIATFADNIDLPLISNNKKLTFRVIDKIFKKSNFDAARGEATIKKLIGAIRTMEPLMAADYLNQIKNNYAESLSKELNEEVNSLADLYTNISTSEK